MIDSNTVIKNIVEKYASKPEDKVSLFNELKDLRKQITLEQINKVQFILDKEKNKLS